VIEIVRKGPLKERKATSASSVQVKEIFQKMMQQDRVTDWIFVQLQFHLQLLQSSAERPQAILLMQRCIRKYLAGKHRREQCMPSYSLQLDFGNSTNACRQTKHCTIAQKTREFLCSKSFPAVHRNVSFLSR
jgi:hypothetical protein